MYVYIYIYIDIHIIHILGVTMLSMLYYIMLSYVILGAVRGPFPALGSGTLGDSTRDWNRQTDMEAGGEMEDPQTKDGCTHSCILTSGSNERIGTTISLSLVT